MRLFCAGLVLACLVAVPTAGFAAEPVTTLLTAPNPSFPTPFATAILGLSLTAVAVVGARVIGSPNLMMYMVLGSVALTAIMVAYSDKLYDEFYAAGRAKVQQLAKEP